MSIASIDLRKLTFLSGASSPRFPSFEEASGSPLSNPPRPPASPPTGDAEEGHYKGVVDFPKLFATISNGDFDFDFENFVSQQFTPVIKQGYVDDAGYHSGAIYDLPVSVPIEIADGNEKKEISPVCILNKREGRVITSKAYVAIRVNPISKKHSYTFYWKYEGDNNSYQSSDFYGSEVNEHAAITVKFNSYEDLFAVTGSQYKKSQIAAEAERVFRRAHTHAKTPAQLNWFYELVPDSILPKLKVDDGKLYEDLTSLMKYDAASWFKDSSTALIKVLRAFDDFEALYKKLLGEGKQVKEIYSVLNDQGRNLFCQFLSALSEAYHGKNEDKTENEFRHGKEYEVNSDLFFKRSEKEVYLQQQLKVKYDTGQNLDGFSSTSVTVFEDVLGNPQSLFNPLDRVSLVSEGGQIQIVPAIYIKLLADKSEWDEVVQAATSALIILSIVVSVGTLGSGAPLLIQAFAVADIAVGTIDLLIQNPAIKKLLAESEQGKWFLDNWHTISLSLGVGMLSYTAVKGIIKHGPELLAKLSKVRGAAKAQAQQMAATIRKLINSAQVELYFSAKLGKVLVGVEPLSIMFNLLRVTAKARVERLGIRLSKALDDGSGIRALIFRGEAIAEGDVKYLKKKLREWLAMRDDELKRVLGELAAATEARKLRKAALVKWGKKFDDFFKNHLGGEWGITKIEMGSFRAEYIEFGQGGHFVDEVYDSIKIIQKIPNPPILNQPYKAHLKIKYRNGQWLTKNMESSMFPEAWSFERIQEEVALVYEKTVVKGISPTFVTKKGIKQFDGFSTNGIQIRIEILGEKIINSHPIIL